MCDILVEVDIALYGSKNECDKIVYIKYSVINFDGL